MPNTKDKKSIRKPGSKILEDTLKCHDNDFIDFLHQCFAWEPEKRFTPDKALKHSWIINTNEKKLDGLNKKNNSLNKTQDLNLMKENKRAVLIKFKETLKLIAEKHDLKNKIQNRQKTNNDKSSRKCRITKYCIKDNNKA